MNGLPSLPRSWGHFHEPKLSLSLFLSIQEVHKAAHLLEAESPFGWRSQDAWEAIQLPASISAWHLLVLLCLTKISAKQTNFIIIKIKKWQHDHLGNNTFCYHESQLSSLFHSTDAEILNLVSFLSIYLSIYMKTAWDQEGFTYCCSGPRCLTSVSSTFEQGLSSCQHHHSYLRQKHYSLD